MKQSGKALNLIQEIILASASIPGVFPPMMIEYEAGGQRYEEMHVHGGVTRQVFLFPAAMKWNEVIRKLGFTGPLQLYIIRNSDLAPEREVVKRKLSRISIKARSRPGRCYSCLRYGVQVSRW